MGSPRQVASETAAFSSPRQWSTLDYVQAMTATAALIAPVPFFWNPPFWVLALMTWQTSSDGSEKSTEFRSTGTANDKTALRDAD